ncbi:hypothetical protein [Pseudoramibacter faecis]|uniref:hypothetical protein n=1 Tax=Pseudoramibacter faecis TaxID=3108534 RepID=UPI002E76C0B5|nr:hypothetical protein [Pseudoramibacter sp. HA2172]
MAIKNFFTGVVWGAIAIITMTFIGDIVTIDKQGLPENYEVIIEDLKSYETLIKKIPLSLLILDGQLIEVIKQTI